MKKKKDLDLAPSRRERKTLGQYILLFFLVLYTLFCALPIVLVFVAAFSDEKTIVQNGFSFIPKKWSLDGINAVLRYGKQLATSYGVTIFITVVGTLVGLLIMATRFITFGISQNKVTESIPLHPECIKFIRMSYRHSVSSGH